jgi:hypothetical protein
LTKQRCSLPCLQWHTAANIEGNKELTIIDYEVIIKVMKAGHRPNIEGINMEEGINCVLDYEGDTTNPNITRAQKQYLRQYVLNGALIAQKQQLTRVVLTQDDICRLSIYQRDEMLQIRSSIEDKIEEVDKKGYVN